MPYIAIRLSGAPAPTVVHHIVAAVNALTDSVLQKDPALMATTVQCIAAQDWFIGGKPLSEIGGSAFQLEISITDETNTKTQKSRYIREIFQAIAALRPDTHPVSYVHLIDARAAAYGYGGQSQEWRYQRLER